MFYFHNKNIFVIIFTTWHLLTSVFLCLQRRRMIQKQSENISKTEEKTELLIVSCNLNKVGHLVQFFLLFKPNSCETWDVSRQLIIHEDFIYHLKLKGRASFTSDWTKSNSSTKHSLLNKLSFNEFKCT